MKQCSAPGGCAWGVLKKAGQVVGSTFGPGHGNEFEIFLTSLHTISHLLRESREL